MLMREDYVECLHHGKFVKQRENALCELTCSASVVEARRDRKGTFKAEESRQAVSVGSGQSWRSECEPCGDSNNTNASTARRKQTLNDNYIL
jgi:hypothetical protein